MAEPIKPVAPVTKTRMTTAPLPCFIQRKSPIIVGCEYSRVILVVSGPAECFDALDKDLTAAPFWVAEVLHHFGNIVRQRHRVGVGRLMRPTKFRLHVRRDKFEDLHGRFPELKSKRLQPGVKKGFTGAVRRESGEWNKG